MPHYSVYEPRMVIYRAFYPRTQRDMQPTASLRPGAGIVSLERHQTIGAHDRDAPLWQNGGARLWTGPFHLREKRTSKRVSFLPDRFSP